MFTAVHACCYVHCSTCLSLRSPQHVLVVTFTAAHACRYVHRSTCLSLRSLQHVLVVTFTAVRACRYIHWSTCLSLCSLRYVHVVMFTAVCVWCNSDSICLLCSDIWQDSQSTANVHLAVRLPPCCPLHD